MVTCEDQGQLKTQADKASGPQKPKKI